MKLLLAFLAAWPAMGGPLQLTSASRYDYAFAVAESVIDTHRTDAPALEPVDDGTQAQAHFGCGFQQMFCTEFESEAIQQSAITSDGFSVYLRARSGGQPSGFSGGAEARASFELAFDVTQPTVKRFQVTQNFCSGTCSNSFAFFGLQPPPLFGLGQRFDDLLNLAPGSYLVRAETQTGRSTAGPNIATGGLGEFRFALTEAPEPATIWMTVAGSALLIWVRRRYTFSGTM